jgi:hypothetical protein
VQQCPKMNLRVQIRTVYCVNQDWHEVALDRGDATVASVIAWGKSKKFYAIGSSECPADANFGRLTGKPEVIGSSYRKPRLN